MILNFEIGYEGWSQIQHWRKISRPYLVTVPNYWTWKKSISLKKRFFWSDPYKIEVMITSLKEILDLPRVLQLVTWPHLQYNLSNVIKFCWWRHGLRLRRHNLFQNTSLLRRTRVANFNDIIKILTMFIKKTFKDSKKLKDLEIMY